MNVPSHTVTSAEAKMAARIFYRMSERDAGDAEPWANWEDLTEEEKEEWQQDLLAIMEWTVQG